MPRVTAFRSKAQLSANENLREFIGYCRDELTWLADQAGFDWRAPTWPHARWCKLIVGKGRKLADSEVLDAEFIEFAKAYFRYKNTEQPTLSRWEVPALKCMEAALLTTTGSGSVQGLSIAGLDEAAVVARAHFTPQARYHVGRSLHHIAQFVSDRGLVSVDVATWRSPLPRPPSVPRTGKLGRAETERKLPSEAGMDAMAEIFANNPTEPRACFISAVWALLLAAPWRISELLRLHVGAEHEELDDNGVVAYGLRYYGAKGFEYDIKWVPKVMEPIAREAFRRIRALTDTGRSLAKHLGRYPDRPFLHSDAPEAGIDDELTIQQKAAYLRHPVPRAAQRQPPWNFRSIRDHWERSRTKLPRGFPVFDKETGLEWSDALFCMHWDLLSVTRTDWHRLWRPYAGTVNDLLGASKRGRGVAERLGYREPDGTPIELRTHQARHFVSTMANRGSMADEVLARWAGRADAKHNAVYNHMSEEEHVQRDRKLLEKSGLLRTSCTLRVNEPTTPTEAAINLTGPTHRTEFGVCEHDWVMSPCTKHGDCIVCTEQAYVKGDTEAYRRVKETIDHHVTECEKALAALRNGTSVADRWLEHALKLLVRCVELLALLDSDEVEDGAVIRLADNGAEHTHLRRELAQREPHFRDDGLPAEIRALIARVENGEALDAVVRGAGRVALGRMAGGDQADVEASGQAGQ